MIFINFTSFLLSTVFVDEESVKFMDDLWLRIQTLTFQETTPRLLQLKLHYFVLVAAGSLVFFVLTRFSLFGSHLFSSHLFRSPLFSVQWELLHICWIKPKLCPHQHLRQSWLHPYLQEKAKTGPGRFQILSILKYTEYFNKIFPQEKETKKLRPDDPYPDILSDLAKSRGSCSKSHKPPSSSSFRWIENTFEICLEHLRYEQMNQWGVILTEYVSRDIASFF